MEPQYLVKDSEDPDEGLTAIDVEEQNAGYQAAYSRLAASESVAADPVAHIRDPQRYLGEELARAAKADPRLKTILTTDPSNAAFVQKIIAAGYSF